MTCNSRHPMGLPHPVSLSCTMVILVGHICLQVDLSWLCNHNFLRTSLIHQRRAHQRRSPRKMRLSQQNSSNKIFNQEFFPAQAEIFGLFQICGLCQTSNVTWIFFAFIFPVPNITGDKGAAQTLLHSSSIFKKKFVPSANACKIHTHVHI